MIEALIGAPTVIVVLLLALTFLFSGNPGDM